MARIDSVGEMIIAIDTREQRPYKFTSAEVMTLKSGDYSIVGMEDRVAIERKTKSDAYGSLGRSRARFQREIERLAEYDYAAIVIEDSVPRFVCRPLYTKMNPNSAIASLLGWSVRYGIHVFFAGDRDHAQALTLKLLEFFWRYHREDQHELQQ